MCVLLPPANVVCEGYVFTHVCHSVHRGGMRGCSGGACVVAPRGVRGCSQGGHACLGGSMCGKGGCAWHRGVCMAKGVCVGHAWQRGCAWWRGACVAKGGVHGEGGACVVKGGMHGMHPPTIYGQSLCGRYASYWNAYLFKNEKTKVVMCSGKYGRFSWEGWGWVSRGGYHPTPTGPRQGTWDIHPNPKPHPVCCLTLGTASTRWIKIDRVLILIH